MYKNSTVKERKKHHAHRLIQRTWENIIWKVWFMCFMGTYCDKSIPPSGLSFSSGFLKYFSWCSCSLILKSTKYRFFHDFCSRNMIYINDKNVILKKHTHKGMQLIADIVPAHLCLQPSLGRRLEQVSWSYFCRNSYWFVEHCIPACGQKKSLLFCDHLFTFP